MDKQVEKVIPSELAERRLCARHTFDSILADSPVMLDLKETAEAYAGTDATVLIQGESGTGK